MRNEFDAEIVSKCVLCGSPIYAQTECQMGQYNNYPQMMMPVRRSCTCQSEISNLLNSLRSWVDLAMGNGSQQP